jgi:hypothetical protein
VSKTCCEYRSQDRCAHGRRSALVDQHLPSASGQTEQGVLSPQHLAKCGICIQSHWGQSERRQLSQFALSLHDSPLPESFFAGFIVKMTMCSGDRQRGHGRA